MHPHKHCVCANTLTDLTNPERSKLLAERTFLAYDTDCINYFCHFKNT